MILRGLPIFSLFLISSVRCKRDFYSYAARRLDGKVEELGKYRGKVSLVVNVASECGYTDTHYKQLIELQKRLEGSGEFTVLAFPSNQFGAQEPGTNAEIHKFITTRYKVNFPVFAKVELFTDPAFKYLIEESDQIPDWNFWKYLVDPTGHVVAAYSPKRSVESLIETVEEEVLKAHRSQHKTDENQKKNEDL